MLILLSVCHTLGLFYRKRDGPHSLKELLVSGFSDRLGPLPEATATESDRRIMSGLAGFGGEWISELS